MPTLVEYAPTPVKLDAADLSFLLETVKTTATDDQARLLESLTPTREHDIYMLRSGPFVGRLALPGGQQLDFRSRFSLSDVFELIRLTSRFPIRIDPRFVPAEAHMSLVELIAAAFAAEVQRLVRQGLAKGYVTVRFDTPPYPGVLDVDRHLRTFTRGGRIVS